MPKFYLTLTTQTGGGSGIRTANRVLEVRTNLPEESDFEQAKEDYCKDLQSHSIDARTEYTIITMCVPMY